MTTADMNLIRCQISEAPTKHEYNARRGITILYIKRKMYKEITKFINSSPTRKKRSNNAYRRKQLTSLTESQPNRYKTQKESKY